MMLSKMRSSANYLVNSPGFGVRVLIFLVSLTLWGYSAEPQEISVFCDNMELVEVTIRPDNLTIQFKGELRGEMLKGLPKGEYGLTRLVVRKTSQDRYDDLARLLSSSFSTGLRLKVPKLSVTGSRGGLLIVDDTLLIETLSRVAPETGE